MTAFQTDLETFLRKKADEMAPLDDSWPDCRAFSMRTNPDSIDGNGDGWLKSKTSYIWRIGVLGQWDSNKMDCARLFIGHERTPTHLEFIGMLYWRSGENDDIGRSLARYCDAAADLSPAFCAD